MGLRDLSRTIGRARALLAAAAYPLLCMAMFSGVPAAAEPVARGLGADPTTATRLARMARVQSWGYWLRFVDFDAAAAAPHDLLVVDFGISANRQFQRQYSLDEIALMKQRKGGGSRILLAYISIGEAERYRPYWRQEWYEPASKPAWLDKGNPQWDGNFAVRFWDPAWQKLIFGAPDSYLERILGQGFDGVYIDRADVFGDWTRQRKSAQADMVSLLTAFAAHARRAKPDFLIVMQNAEELLPDPKVMGIIDGIAKEDLFFGIKHNQEANSKVDVDWSLEHIRMAQKAGRTALLVEYVDDPARQGTVLKRSREAGIVPYFAPRGLECLRAIPGTPASGC